MLQRSMAAAGEVTKLFNNAKQAAAYRRFRPSYPPAVLREAVKGATRLSMDEWAKPTGLAVDVACGSGQLTTQIAEHFERVVGFDPSEEQLANAAEDFKIEYRAGQAEALEGLEDSCADLVSVGQGLHWFDHVAFFNEAARVLRHKGVLLCLGYAVPTFDNPAAQAAVDHFYREDVGPFWHANRTHVESRYAGIAPELLWPPHAPFGAFTRLRHVEEKTTTIAAVLGSFESWSAYTKLAARAPKSGAMAVERCRKALHRAYGADDDDHEIVAKREFFGFWAVNHKEGD